MNVEKFSARSHNIYSFSSSDATPSVSRNPPFHVSSGIPETRVKVPITASGLIFPILQANQDLVSLAARVRYLVRLAKKNFSLGLP